MSASQSADEEEEAEEAVGEDADAGEVTEESDSLQMASEETKSGESDETADNANAEEKEEDENAEDEAADNGENGIALTSSGETEITGTVEETVIQTDGDWMSNEDMLNGYVTELIQGYGISALGTSARDTLSEGLEKNLYDFLKTEIEAVAAGDVTSTVFKLDLAALGLDGYYTAADLGIGEIVVDGSISSDATAALIEKSGIKDAFSAVIYALLTDCPYDLYWYDKTSDGGSKTSYSYSYSSSSGLSLSEITYSMTVASAYQSASAYTVNSSGVTAAKTALANAQAIVTQYASYSDYDKLEAYLDEIKALTSYNSEAAAENYSGGYGDPWQLIYVFDGDETTTVVCEGYSKAFMYLCDLSTFEDDDLYCYTVSGTMSGGTGAGPHMWNIVHTSQGNYLVDVTNCDAGTIGADYQLFMICGADATAASAYPTYSFELTSGTITYTYDSSTQAQYPSPYTEAYLYLASDAYEKPKSGMTVTVTPYSGTYDGAAHKAVTAVTVTSGPSTSTVTYSKDGGSSWTSDVPTITDAGTLSVMVKIEGDDTYSDYTATVTATVTKRPVTVTIDDQSCAWGEVLPAFTWQITSGSLVDGEDKNEMGISLEAVNTNGDSTDVGTYVITGTSNSQNYDVTFVNGTLTVNRATASITVTSTEITKTYGDPDFDLGYKANGDAEVCFMVGQLAIATVNNGTVHINGAGYTNVLIYMSQSDRYTYAEANVYITVEKAAAPTVEEQTKSYIYTKGSNGAVSVDISELLPEDAGTVTCSVADTTDSKNLLSDVSISGSVLSYTVASGDPGSTASITVDVEMANYEDTTVTLNISLVDKETVELKSGSSVISDGGNELVYGQTLSELTLSQDAEFVASDSGETVTGKLSFVTPNEVPAAGTTAAAWVFTPDDSDTYESLTGTVSILVSKATPDVTVPTTAGLTYHPSVTLADVTLSGGSAEWTVGGSNVAVEGTWSWQDSSQTPTVINSGYTVVFTPADTTNYNSVTATVSVNVTKATPSIVTSPTASVLTYGQTLSESTLSGGATQYSSDSSVAGYNQAVAGAFSWSSDTAEVTPTVSDSDSTAYTVIFTPTDTDNYEEATATVTVTVAQRNLSDATVAIPTAAYIGSTRTPSESVVLDGTALTADTDYTVSYWNGDGEEIESTKMVDAGSYTVRITGKGNYTGTLDAVFTITPASIAEFTYNTPVAYYTGTARTFTAEELAAFTICSANGVTILTASDFVIDSYADNVNLTSDSSKATVTITGQGNYTGSLTLRFDIVNKDMSAAATATEGWTTTAVITAPENYTISAERSGNYTNSFTWSTESASADGTEVTYYLKDGDGYISVAKTVKVYVDTTLPVNGGSDGITVADKTWWKSVLETITFDFYQEKNVTLSATDALSGIQTYYYYVDFTDSTVLLSADELSGKTFTEASGGSFSLNVQEDDSYVIYAYAVDKAGDASAYFCSEGMVLDTTAPTLTLAGVSSITDESAVLTLVLSETGNYYYVISESEIADIDADQVIALSGEQKGSVADGQAGQEVAVSLKSLSHVTGYYVYAAAVDAAGNVSTVRSIDFTTAKSAAPALEEVELVYTYAEASGTSGTVDVGGALPTDRGNTAYSITVTDENGILSEVNTDADGSLTYTFSSLSESGTGSTASIAVTAVMESYEDAVLSIEIEITDIPEQRIDVEIGLSEVPEALLSNEALNTPAKIEAVLKTVIDSHEGYTKEDSILYDAKLMISFDGGKTWEAAKEENFPENGLTIILPYPEGTGKDTHDFTATHMFTVTSSRLGTTAGEMEDLTVTKTDEGLQVTVHGLSPIAIGWKEVTVANNTTSTDDSGEDNTETNNADTNTSDENNSGGTAETGDTGTSDTETDSTEGAGAETVESTVDAAESAPTGDDSPIMLSLAVLLLAGTGIVVYGVMRKRQKKSE